MPRGEGVSLDPNPFNGYVFTGLNMGGPITGVQISQLGYTNLDFSDISFTANSVSINLQDTSADIAANWLITLKTGAPGPGIPEVGTMELLALGLTALVVKLRILR